MLIENLENGTTKGTLHRATGAICSRENPVLGRHEMAEKSVPKDSAGDVVNGGEKEESGEKMVAMAKVPFHSMFKYADRTDVLLMLVGMVGALGNGMSMVIMTIIFGQMIDAFGGATPDTIVPRVNKVWL